MKGLILVLGLMSLVGCSDISVMKNKLNSQGGADPDTGFGTLKIEMVPYQITQRDTLGNPTTSIPPIPKHEQFIDYLQRRSVVLSDAEKDLIRTDDSSFKVYLNYLFKESAPSTVSGSYIVEQFVYKLEVHLAGRVVEISEGTIASGEAFYVNNVNNITSVTFDGRVQYPGAEDLWIRSNSQIREDAGVHLYNQVNIRLGIGSNVEVILDIKNSQTVSICENYNGDLLDQYCPYSFE